MPDQRGFHFEARIEPVGVNPAVDVPPRVSRAFSKYAEAGRIRVEGELNDTPIQATLMPVAGGGHRLYVNGGMRSAAGVEVGQTVTLRLRRVSGAGRVPRDVAAGLRRVRGARAAFDALPPSRRRELMRYIDDARTPENRRKRIFRTAEHVLGGREPGRRGAQSTAAKLRARPLWTCPECGHQFVNTNQYHSCQRHTLAEVFAARPAWIRELFGRFRRMVEACGPVKMVVYRDRVGFMVRVRFAGATPRQNWLDVRFWLTRRIEHARFRKVETLDPRTHIYAVRVTEPSELDDDLASWIEEAYAVGCQEHL